MTISVTCGQCAKSFKAPDSAAGRKAKCPSCGNPIAIPETEPAAEAAPAAEPAAATGDDPMAALVGAVGEARPAVAAEPVAPQPLAPPAAEPAIPEPAIPLDSVPTPCVK